MPVLRLIKAYLRVNLQMALAYRAEAVVHIAVNLMWLGWELLSLTIIFNNTATLGGWGPGELVALLGVFRLVNTLMAAVIWPNTEYFNTSVRDGSLDYMLLLPVNSLFVVTFSRLTLWRLWEPILAVILIAAGLGLSGAGAAPLNLAAFLVLVLAGAVILYSLWIALIAFTFWFTKFDNNVTILQALLDTGRYPATVYPTWLRVIVTFIVPIALATTVPLQALRGELSGPQVALFLGISLLSLWVATQIWRRGVRRYNGASS